jgi:hypothetical protein
MVVEGILRHFYNLLFLRLLCLVTTFYTYPEQTPSRAKGTEMPIDYSQPEWETLFTNYRVE